MAMITRKALKSFSSTVWGNVSEGEPFTFDEGYKQSLIDGGVIAADRDKRTAAEKAEDEADEKTVRDIRAKIASGEEKVIPAKDADAFERALTGQNRGRR